MLLTPFTSCYDSSILGLCKYTVFRQDRHSGTDPHGGVLIVARNELKPVVIPTTDKHESIFMDLTPSCGDIRMCCVCRAPIMPPWYQ